MLIYSIAIQVVSTLIYESYISVLRLIAVLYGNDLNFFIVPTVPTTYYLFFFFSLQFVTSHPLSLQHGDLPPQEQHHHVSSVRQGVQLLETQHCLWNCPSQSPVWQPCHCLLLYIYGAVGSVTLHVHFLRNGVTFAKKDNQNSTYLRRNHVTSMVMAMLVH